MKKYKIREQGQIKRVLDNKKKDKYSNIKPEDFEVYDKKMRTKF